MSERHSSGGPTKVLYIGGTGRTGSTVLTRLLGEIDGWFPAGELAFFWRKGLGQGGSCSCGELVEVCPTWSAVLADMSLTVDPARMVELRRKCWSGHLPLMLLNDRLASRVFDRLEDFPPIVNDFYRSISSVTGSRVIIDSSKEPHYSWILRDRTDLDVYFLHLVRDPRAVQYSWSKSKVESGFGGSARMERRGVLRAATYFGVSNFAAERIWGSQMDAYRFLRYEDFLDHPEATLNQIAEFIGEPLGQSPLHDGSFAVNEQHIAWGNPNRFDTGEITLRGDHSWKQRSASWRSVANWLANAPFASRYGYRFDRRQPPLPNPHKTLQPRQLLRK